MPVQDSLVVATATTEETGKTHKPIPRKAICAPQALNEAPAYGSAFSRGLRLDIKGVTILLISGTASVDEEGRTVHPGDFAAQTWRTYRNITGLLEAEGATWKDIVRTTCYLRDIERDYAEFNRIRTEFFKQQGLNPLPASTGIQAILCRPDLLIEIEAIAIWESDRGKGSSNGDRMPAAA
jgi:enamine deaminase RidA (YjgF/YER057c/UK114 family)